MIYIVSVIGYIIDVVVFNNVGIGIKYKTFTFREQKQNKNFYHHMANLLKSHIYYYIFPTTHMDDSSTRMKLFCDKSISLSTVFLRCFCQGL